MISLSCIHKDYPHWRGCLHSVQRSNAFFKGCQNISLIGMQSLESVSSAMGQQLSISFDLMKARSLALQEGTGSTTTALGVERVSQILRLSLHQTRLSNVLYCNTSATSSNPI